MRATTSTLDLYAATPQDRLDSQRGLSLLEVLFAGFLVATVAVFIAPLFVRAVASNIEGNEASVAMNFGKSFIEQSLATDYNNPILDGRTTAPGATDTTVRRIQTLVYDTGPKDRLGGLDRELGDEGWRVRTGALVTSTDRRHLWDFDLDLREYSYSDILDALVSSTVFTDPGNPTVPLVLVPLPGDPDVFDSPLDASIQSRFRHIKEMTTTMVSRREGGGILGSADSTVARRMRSY